MTAKQKPARSTAVAWRRALKAIGVPLDGIHVRTIYNRPPGNRFSEPISKYACPPESATAQITERARDFADLVAAAGWSAHVILRATTSRHPYIEITNGPVFVRDNDTLLATTAENED